MWQKWISGADDLECIDLVQYHNQFLITVWHISYPFRCNDFEVLQGERELPDQFGFRMGDPEQLVWTFTMGRRQIWVCDELLDDILVRNGLGQGCIWPHHSSTCTSV